MALKPFGALVLAQAQARGRDLAIVGVAVGFPKPGHSVVRRLDARTAGETVRVWSQPEPLAPATLGRIAARIRATRARRTAPQRPPPDSTEGLGVLRYGVTMAMRGGIRKSEVLNTRGAAELATAERPAGGGGTDGPVIPAGFGCEDGIQSPHDGCRRGSIVG